MWTETIYAVCAHYAYGCSWTIAVQCTSFVYEARCTENLCFGEFFCLLKKCLSNSWQKHQEWSKLKRRRLAGSNSSQPFLCFCYCYEIQYFVLNDDVDASKTMVLASSRNGYLPDCSRLYNMRFFLDTIWVSSYQERLYHDNNEYKAVGNQRFHCRDLLMIANKLENWTRLGKEHMLNSEHFSFNRKMCTVVSFSRFQNNCGGYSAFLPQSLTPALDFMFTTSF